MLKIIPLCVLVLSTFVTNIFAQQPAPADTGLANDGPVVVTADKPVEDTEDTKTAGDTTAEDKLSGQVADLKTQLETLQSTLDKITETQKEVEQIRGKVAILRGDADANADRIKTLESQKDALDMRIQTLEEENATLAKQLREFSGRVADLEDAEPTEQTTAKPAFVKSAVVFYNHEERPLRMNVNGVWHIIKEGKNMVWVPYAPVHIYRYTGAEPRMFWDWQSFGDGYVMEFDVGTPEK